MSMNTHLLCGLSVAALDHDALILIGAPCRSFMTVYIKQIWSGNGLLVLYSDEWRWNSKSGKQEFTDLQIAYLDAISIHTLHAWCPLQTAAPFCAHSWVWRSPAQHATRENKIPWKYVARASLPRSFPNRQAELFRFEYYGASFSLSKLGSWALKTTIGCCVFASSGMAKESTAHYCFFCDASLRRTIQSEAYHLVSDSNRRRKAGFCLSTERVANV